MLSSSIERDALVCWVDAAFSSDTEDSDSTESIIELCEVINCKIEDIVEYVPDE